MTIDLGNASVAWAEKLRVRWRTDKADEVIPSRDMSGSRNTPRGRGRGNSDPCRPRLPSLREILGPEYFDPPRPSSSASVTRLALPTIPPTSSLSHLQIDSPTRPRPVTPLFPRPLAPFRASSLQVLPPPKSDSTLTRPLGELSLRRYSLDSYAPHPPLPSTPQSQRSSRSSQSTGSHLRRSSHPAYSARRHSSTPTTAISPGSPDSDKRHSCSFCPRSFSRRWDCERHELIHTGHRYVDCSRVV